MKKSISIVVIFAVALIFSQSIFAQEIFDAIRSSNLAKVKELVEKDPQMVNARNARRSTPLHIAADLDHVDMARYFIKKGADVNAINGDRKAPLFYARQVDMAELLVEKGADINLEAYNKNTAVVWSLFYKRREVAEYLLEKGARLPDPGAELYLQCLINSLKSGSTKYLEHYIRSGFNPYDESEAKSNLLHYASESQSSELISKLISLRVPVDEANIFGLTPLHIAALNGNLEVAKRLVRKGAARDLRTNNGKTAYNLAVESQKDGVAEYLKSVGADQGPQRYPVLTGEYAGQPKPGVKAVPFAPGIVTDQESNGHGAMTITPDGNEMYWSDQNRSTGRIVIKRIKRINERWGMPEIFKTGYDVPFISPVGNKMYFTQWRVPTKWGVKTIIGSMERTASGWSEPTALPDIINAVPNIHWQVSVDNKGNIYFADFGSPTVDPRIYSSEYKNGEYGTPKLIETLKDVRAYSPYIAPDGSYLIISNQQEGLTILFRKKDGSWTQETILADHLGKTGWCPMVTPDGKYLFFIAALDGMNRPYWADAGFIEDLRKKELQKN